MRKIPLMLAALLMCAGAHAEETARIRIAGLFLKGFTAWRVAAPNCAVPAAKPWLKLDCGLMKCPKPTLLGIPGELDYSNWRKSPRMTEMVIDAGKPFAMHFGGMLITGTMGDAVASMTGLPYSLEAESCVFDVRFTPRANANYEATIDPGRKGGCVLYLSEIRLSETGIAERVAIEGAERMACGLPAGSSN